MIDDEADAFQPFRTDSMFLKQAASELTLQRGKAKVIVPVPLQDKLHCPIAEFANAVVENDRIRVLIRHG